MKFKFLPTLLAGLGLVGLSLGGGHFAHLYGLQAPNAFLTAQQKITTPGTAVQVINPAGSFGHSGAYLVCPTSNTSPVEVGYSSAVTNAIDGTGNGFPIQPGQSYPLDLGSSTSLWINGTTAGDVLWVLGN